MTYLTLVNKVNVQNINDTDPKIKSVETLAKPPFPSIIAFITYKGLVPMSP